MKELVELEEEILKYRGRPLAGRPADQGQEGRLRRQLSGEAARAAEEADIREQRTRLGVVEGWDAVPVSGVENAAYYYSTYNAPDATVASSNPRKVMVLGGGPNRIGQGIEFDYCCVHAAFALRDEGYESIMVNCNPETVSTDYDTSDKLYFEPLTVEDVLSIYEKEKPGGRDRAVRRPDAAEHRGRTGRRRGEDPRHVARDHRPGRGPRPLPQDDGQAGHPDARVGHGGHGGRGDCRSRSASAIR